MDRGRYVVAVNSQPVVRANLVHVAARRARALWRRRAGDRDAFPSRPSSIKLIRAALDEAEIGFDALDGVAAAAGPG